MKKLPLLLLLGALVVSAPGCKSMYYGTMGAFGYQKRHLLVGNVEEARDKQEDAKEKFTSALDEFRAVVAFEEGDDLEAMYKKLNRAYERSVSSANAVRNKIEDVESVAAAMFKEWEGELDEFSTAEARRNSEQQLRETKDRYERMLAAMRRAEASMQPVLDVLNDRRLTLKHSLNAAAVASIQGTAGQVQDDVAELIAEMERSIAEANAFIDQMGGE